MVYIVPVKRQSLHVPLQALNNPCVEYGSFEPLERLLASPAFRGLKVCRIEQAGEQAVVLQRSGSTVAFTAIRLEKETGRFYHVYQSEWGDGARKDYRHYFAGAQDAARFLEFVIRRAN